ncbi:MAG: hypothetical protein U0230_04790 [Polyangiales bacterium]
MPTGPAIERIVGVYHADGSLRGELAYVVGKLLGTAHCALCDVTHGSVREKASFRALRAACSVPFELVHLDERDAPTRAFTEGRTPCVIGFTREGPRMLLDDAALRRCGGDVERFRRALDEALAS